MDWRQFVKDKMESELIEPPDDTFRNRDPYRIAKNLEKSIYNHSINQVPEEEVPREGLDWGRQFKDLYSKTFRKVLFNLFKNPCSEVIRERIRNKHIKYTDIATMTHQELNPGILHEAKQLYDNYTFVGKVGKEQQKIIDENKGLFRCGRCRSEKTTYRTCQTRSSDEPETVFVTCLRCNNRWRF